MRVESTISTSVGAGATVGIGVPFTMGSDAGSVSVALGGGFG